MSGQDCEQLMLFQVDSPASRSAAPGSDEARMMTVTSGRKCLELSKSSGPLGLLEKMLLESSVWRSTRCYLTWKTRVTKQGRLLFQLAASMPRTEDTDVLLWPTVTASDWKHQGPNSHQKGPQEAVRMWPTPTTGAGLCGGTGNYQQLKALEESGQITEEERKSMAAGNGGQLNPAWVEWLMGFPIGWTDLSASETP